MDPDRPLGVPGCDRLFVECDSQGEILWMNDRARARLGSARNFLDAVPSAQVSEAWQLLRGGNPGDEPAMTFLFGASGVLLWLGERDTRFRFASTVVLHDGLMYISLALLLGHLYLAVIHPATRHALRGMTVGTVSEEWARRHHPKWTSEETP